MDVEPGGQAQQRLVLRKVCGGWQGGEVVAVVVMVLVPRELVENTLATRFADGSNKEMEYMAHTDMIPVVSIILSSSLSLNSYISINFTWFVAILTLTPPIHNSHDPRG